MKTIQGFGPGYLREFAGVLRRYGMVAGHCDATVVRLENEFSRMRTAVERHIIRKFSGFSFTDLDVQATRIQYSRMTECLKHSKSYRSVNLIFTQFSLLATQAAKQLNGRTILQAEGEMPIERFLNGCANPKGMTAYVAEGGIEDPKNLELIDSKLDEAKIYPFVNFRTNDLRDAAHRLNMCSNLPGIRNTLAGNLNFPVEEILDCLVQNIGCMHLSMAMKQYEFVRNLLMAEPETGAELILKRAAALLLQAHYEMKIIGDTDVVHSGIDHGAVGYLTQIFRNPTKILC